MKKVKLLFSLFLTLAAVMVVCVFGVAATGTDFETATDIDVNCQYTDNISKNDDRDFYTFTLSSPGYIYINFKHENLFDQNEYWYISLYNLQTELISEYSILGTTTETNTYRVGLNKGTYYLRIVGGNYDYYSHRYNSCDYSFSVKYTKSSYWEKENNNSFKTATPIKVNLNIYGSINNKNDNDYYKFTLSEDGTITIDFKHPNYYDSNEYYTYWIYDSKTSEIACFDVSGSNTLEKSAKIGLQSGTYYFRIVGGAYDYYSHRFQTDNYSFSINYTSTKYAEKENNEDCSTATEINLAKTYVGSINDKSDTDYYKLYLNKRTNVTVTFLNKKIVDNQEYYICEIYNEHTESIGRFIVNGVDTTVKYNITLPTGTYYFKIIGGAYDYYSHRFKTDDYSFIVTENITVGKISSIKASSTTDTVTLSWSKVNNASGYQVYRYIVSEKRYKKILTTKDTKCTINSKITKLTPGTTYKFRVRAYRKVGDMVYYGAVKEIIVSTRPTAPTLKVVAGSKKATLAWNKQSGATGYVVYMATSKNGKYSRIAVVKGNSNVKYTKTGLTSGKAYYFKVYAYRTVNSQNYYSAASPLVGVKIK